MENSAKGSELSKYSTLGKEIPQVNHRAKVMGRAQYAGDLKLPGMLHGAILRSPYAHARIVRIDVSAARALPGVKAVLTGEDAPATPWGGGPIKERYVLAKGVVRFAGEEVAAVAALTEDIARDALDLIQVEYEELPALLTPEQALSEDAPTVHPERKNNIAHEIEFHRGDVEAGFASADLVFEATYSTSRQYPGYLEPMVSVASLESDDRLHVWTSTQTVFLARSRIAKALELPISSVRVIQQTTGGGFGGKIVEDDNQLVAGLLALHTRRPVRLLNNRLEDFLSCCTSVPEQITLKLGMTREGLVVAKDVHIVADCGAYSGLAGEVMHVSAMRSDNMQRNMNVRCHADLVYTNTPPHGAFRGFGGSQMLFALNSHIDAMARELGLDPAVIHERNAMEQGETTVHGWKIRSTGFKQCLVHATEAIDWANKRAAPRGTGVRRRGVGLAAAMHVCGNRTMGDWDGSTVMLALNDDGGITARSGECDMGQGAMTMITQIIANEFKVPLSAVRLLPPDTDSAPFALGTFASRVTMSAGNAAIRASHAARDKLFALAATLLQVAPGDLEMADGGGVQLRGSDKTLSLAELARAHVWRHGGEILQVSGTWDPDTEEPDEQLYGNCAPTHSFAAQAIEVEVDTETGQVTVLDSFLSDDLGRALNLTAVHGQANGGNVQAIGWALYEDLRVEDGRIVNGNFADYTMPTAESVPMLRGDFVESMDPVGPYGAKASSETAILMAAPAIANAVYDAVGVRIRDLPITPEKVLAGLQAKKEQQGAVNA
ncbi:xanthine dehydrogenase family protein molybdopterin-binding subunit [Eoetvoesiella caeni]|uniref:CO/xanthine dehydrogenase Mo-binding subunit n=1 Tax=Eoetvoesiella caeni TaxID=645616 RepID=A0A366HLC1_9BURK|nr:xanthine dehydrogenase family protein molybdopterin-binding subunit [Eoetvoesiella caeni]MCI2807220.1 xanthine dehydrogenase family protein molybdopterin-binding subunit [Eoetvoesiella caeni]NYT53383.1 molybdopterin-dependent oxidoreductase [Eoetvoesiella caeni]RBP43367.1 CO/xanthine dehydrogenase Mo-binding subunit [Eoetvoesiella caeni]